MEEQDRKIDNFLAVIINLWNQFKRNTMDGCVVLCHLLCSNSGESTLVTYLCICTAFIPTYGHWLFDHAHKNRHVITYVM